MSNFPQKIRRNAKKKDNMAHSWEQNRNHPQRSPAKGHTKKLQNNCLKYVQRRKEHMDKELEETRKIIKNQDENTNKEKL